MRKAFGLKELIAEVASAAAGCSTNTHDAVQTNAPAPTVMRGATLTNAPAVNSAGPASMTTPGTEALAIAAANANSGGRFLGYIEGVGPSPSGNVSPVTGQVLEPALRVPNPPMTVNASISSGPNSVITTGVDAGGASGAIVAAPATTSGVTAGVTAAATVAPITNASSSLTASAATNNGVSAAPIFVTPATTATPTNAANTLTAGQFAT